MIPPTVPPVSTVPPTVPPDRASQTAAVPPVPPCSPYFEVLTKNENRSSERGSSERGSSERDFSCLYENRGQQGEQGEHIDAKRVNPVPPPCSPPKQGEQTDDFISHPSPKQPTAAPVDADPIAARIAELEAEGWSPWNAKARAEDEAREARP